MPAMGSYRVGHDWSDLAAQLNHLGCICSLWTLESAGCLGCWPHFGRCRLFWSILWDLSLHHPRLVLTTSVLPPHTHPGSSHQLSKFQPSPAPQSLLPTLSLYGTWVPEASSHFWFPHWINYIPWLCMCTLLTQSVFILGNTPPSSLG